MKFKTQIFLFAAIVCFVPDANAYLDPGSGSYLVQMIIAGVLGGFAAIKLYWNRIVNFFRGGSDSSTGDDDLDNE